MAISTLVALRPVLLDRVIREGQPYVPADEHEERELLKTGRWKKASKADLDAWKTHLSRDPALAANIGGDAEVDETEYDEYPKVKARKAREAAAAAAEAEAKRLAEEQAQAQAEAEQKAADAARAAAGARGKAEADTKPGPSGGAPGPGGIG